MSAIGNRFMVLSLVEDLTLASESGGDATTEVVARTKALKHLPALSKTLGPGWTEYEVAPFLEHCIRMDDPAVVAEIAGQLPAFVRAYGAATMAPVLAALAASSSRDCRKRLVEIAPIAFLCDDFTAHGQAAQAHERGPEGAAVAACEIFVEVVTDLITRSPWPAARAAALCLATTPRLALRLLSLGGRVSSGLQRRVDDAVRRCVKRVSTAVAESPVEAQLEWLVVAAFATAAIQTAERTLMLGFIADGLPLPAGCSLGSAGVVCGVDVSAPSASTHLFANAALRDEAERAVGHSAAMLDCVVRDGLTSVTLDSPVPWAVEAALDVTAALLQTLRDIAVPRGAGRRERPAIEELSAELAASLLQALVASTGHVDFRVRLLFGRFFATIAEAAADAVDTVSVAGHRLPVVVSELLGSMVADSLRSVVQDPEGDVRCEGAKAAAAIAANLAAGTSSMLPTPPSPPTLPVPARTMQGVSALMTLADQARIDPVPFVRECICPAIASLAQAMHRLPSGDDGDDGVTQRRGSGGVAQRDRLGLYNMLVDLMRDDAANVRLAATVGLSHCIRLVGRRRVEADLCEAAAALNTTQTMWRAREVLAKGMPRVLEVFVLPPPAAASPSSVSHQSGSAVTERTLAFGDEDDDGDDSAGDPSDAGPASAAQSQLLNLLAAQLLDSARAVRDAALLAVCECELRMRRRLLHERGVGAPALSAIGVHRPMGSSSSPPREQLRCMLTDGLWPLVRDSEHAKRHYLLRTAQLHVAVAFGLDWSRELLPLVQAQAADPVANVRRAVALMLQRLLRRRGKLDSELSADETARDPAASMELAAKALVDGAAVELPPAARSGAVLDVLRTLVEDPSSDVRDAASAALADCH